MSTKKPLEGEVVGALLRTQKSLKAEAQQMHQQIQEAAKHAQDSFTELGALFARMKERGLWRYLPGHYRRWEDYVEAVLGPRARSTLYEILGAHTLTQGSNPIPAHIVKRMGVKKAYQLSRLENSQRTPELVKKVASASSAHAKNIVQERINQDLPKDERRPMLQLLTRNLPADLIAEIEELEEDGIWMEGIRDGDSTVTLRVKLWTHIVRSYRETMAEELAEGRKYRLAMEAKQREKAKAKTAKASRASEEDDYPSPPEPEDFAAARR